MHNFINNSINGNMNSGPFLGRNYMESTGQHNYIPRNNDNNNLNNNGFFNENCNTRSHNQLHINPQMMFPPMIYYNFPIPIPNPMIGYMNNPMNYGGINSPNNINNPSIINNPYVFNNNNLATISNTMQYDIEQTNIKSKEILEQSKENFIDYLNNNYSVNLIQDKEPESFRKLFNANIVLVFKLYEKEMQKKNYFKIYLKKINNKYEFDYYNFKDYDIDQNFDLINEYLTKKKIAEKEINNMSQEMKNECICEHDIKLFIFNQFCFLSPYTVSVYIPHILKVKHKNSFLTYFLNNKDLEINDFVIEQTNNENSLFIKILNIRLENLKNNNYINDIEFGLEISKTGEEGFLYTTIPTELIEQSILELDLEKFGNNYIGGYSSKKVSTIRSAFTYSNNENDRTFFEKNEDYLRGMSTQELILFFICHELKEYINLPRLIIYENLMDLKGKKIYKNKNLTFIEFDSIIQSKTEFIYNDKFPLRIQKFYEIDKNKVIDKKNPDDSNFKIEKDNIYFFEIKNLLNKDNIKKILLNIIKNYQVFYNTFIKNKFIDNNNTPNIVFIYDYHKIELDLKDILDELLNKTKNEFKINIQIIYCFPNYSYFSFNKLNIDLKDLKKIQEQNQKEIHALKEENKEQKEQNQKEIHALKEENKEQKEQNQKIMQELKEQKEQNQKEIHALKEENKELKEQNQKIMQELKEQKELKEQNQKIMQELKEQKELKEQNQKIMQELKEQKEQNQKIMQELKEQKELKEQNQKIIQELKEQK